ADGAWHSRRGRSDRARGAAALGSQGAAREGRAHGGAVLNAVQRPTRGGGAPLAPGWLACTPLLAPTGPPPPPLPPSPPHSVPPLPTVGAAGRPPGGG